MNPSKPTLLPNKPYCRPFNYLEYVKDFDPNAQIRNLKIAIRANGETDDAKIVNLFSFTLKDSCLISVTIT
jgi:hypothetical protein